jgi:hypothetical protein
LNGSIPSEGPLTRISLLYSDCLDALGQLDEADIWRKQSFNLYRWLIQHELKDAGRSEAATLDDFIRDHVDRLFQYDFMDATDMEYGLIASK